MMIFLAVASNSCLAVDRWLMRRCQKVAAKFLFGRGRPAKQQLRRLCQPLLWLCLCVFLDFFSADQSSEERLEILVLQLNLSLLISWRHFLMKKSKDENWPSGGVHLDFRIWSVSKVSLFEVLESSSLLKAFQLNAAKEFFNVLLNRKFVGFLDLGTKFKPLLRTDFSESESSKLNSFKIFRRWVASNLRADKLIEFLGLNLVQIFKKFRIGILNFGANGLY